MTTTFMILAGFTQPYEIGTNPSFFLWLIPLVLGISVVYKTIKLEALKWGKLIKEVGLLSGSIIFFIVIIASVLSFLAWLLTE
jgi:hypothetical protein